MEKKREENGNDRHLEAAIDSIKAAAEQDGVHSEAFREKCREEIKRAKIRLENDD